MRRRARRQLEGWRACCAAARMAALANVPPARLPPPGQALGRLGREVQLVRPMPPSHFVKPQSVHYLLDGAQCRDGKTWHWALTVPLLAVPPLATLAA